MILNSVLSIASETDKTTNIIKDISVTMENNQIEYLPTNIKPISDNMISLFPKLLPVLSNSGHLYMWVRFNKFLADNKFPINHIAFKLFIDIVDFI